MEGRKRWWGTTIILGFVLLFPLSARSKDPMDFRRNLTANISANGKATLRYEYQRLVKFYLHNDGNIEPQEQTVLDILREKWQISPEEAEKIHKEAKENIR